MINVQNDPKIYMDYQNVASVEFKWQTYPAILFDPELLVYNDY